MRKYLIFFGIIIILTFLLLGNANQETMSMEEYANEFYKNTDEFNQIIEDRIFSNVPDMLVFNEYNQYYSNIELINGLTELVSYTELMLINLSNLGYDIENQDVQISQSKLEDHLKDLQNIIKGYLNNEKVNVQVVNQFTLYQEYFELLHLIKVPFNKINEYCFEIEKTLNSLDLDVSDTYYITRLKNIKRFMYQYSILGAQVSTYQDYTGLQVNPKNSVVLSLGEDIYGAYELSTSIMLPLVKELESEMILNKKYEASFLNSEQIMKPTDIYLEWYIEMYLDYSGVRLEFTDDFYKSGEFKEYQTKIKLKHTYGYSFDIEKFTEINFNTMMNSYMKLYYSIREAPHLNYMSY